MNVKNLILNSLFLAIGAVLHQISPPIVLGMKPDFSLVMLFIIMILNKDYKTCISAGIVAGILSAATTTFPGGQIANFIDKIVTANVIFLFLKPMRNNINCQLKIILVTIVGTIVSGTVFLTAASLMVGLPTKFAILFLSVVLPASLINTVASLILSNVVNTALRRAV
ncbi:tryptophan transporter [Clostridium sp. CX1]|uniref:tryptophan transporter n=1 Tax=Clostridium sp. CX1 TaxID=2978346 RepID=UPI0021BF4467|nr:tryptophan transporter [Clostridium sp. CX1]MCT8978101.1 tryptophan transporter [Clostridium sp. CX1]